MGDERVEVSREVMIAFGQAAVVGNLKKLNSTDRKIIQTMIEALHANRESVVVESCNIQRLDRIMAKLSTLPVSDRSKFKQLTNGFINLFGLRISANELKLKSQKALDSQKVLEEANAKLRADKSDIATFQKLIRLKKEALGKSIDKPIEKPTGGDALRKLSNIASFEERQSVQTRSRDREVQYLTASQIPTLTELFTDHKFIHDVWSNLSKEEEPAKRKMSDYLGVNQHNMYELVDRAIRVSSGRPELRSKLEEAKTKFDFSSYEWDFGFQKELSTLLNQVDPSLAKRFKVLSAFQYDLKSYLTNADTISPKQIQIWERNSRESMHRVDEELKEASQKLKRLQS